MSKILHTVDFVYGDLILLDIKEDRCSISGRRDKKEHSTYLQKGDEIVYCNNLNNQSWICTGTVTGFDVNNKNIIIDEVISLNPEAECYIGVIERGKK